MIDNRASPAYYATMADSSWTESELIADVRNGKEDACAEMVRRYGGPMLAVIRRFLRNEADASEALQDAFLSSFRNIQQFDGAAKLSTWLHTIAVNAALQKLRRAKSRPEKSLDDLLPTFLADGHHSAEVVDWSPTALALAEKHETRSQIRAAIDKLPENYRTVLLARDIEQLDTEQTAAALGLSVAVVKTRLHRARQALRTLLEAVFAGDLP